ncbi:hypothetical protein NKG99_09330 [Mesorhizobium sp. M1409]|uniref:hypothetical protein n=1 Tax=unclassified Mesorhizobium TaxID=325217 RepID=UPI003337C399
MFDVSYATTARTVSPVEQHVHSFLEMIPLIGIVSVISLHWVQFQALFGFGEEPARFGIAWKPEPLPVGYVATVMILVLLLELLPYLEEFVRGLHANGWRLIPNKTRRAKSGSSTRR